MLNLVHDLSVEGRISQQFVKQKYNMNCSYSLGPSENVGDSSCDMCWDYFSSKNLVGTFFSPCNFQLELIKGNSDEVHGVQVTNLC